MANIFIYTGLAVMLLGGIAGLLIAIKGYRDTDWHSVRRISIYGRFQQGTPTPAMKKLTRLWAGIMITGLVFTAIGITIGLK